MAIACQTGEIADDLFDFVCSLRGVNADKKIPAQARGPYGLMLYSRCYLDSSERRRIIRLRTNHRPAVK